MVLNKLAVSKACLELAGFYVFAALGTLFCFVQTGVFAYFSLQEIRNFLELECPV